MSLIDGKYLASLTYSKLKEQIKEYTSLGSRMPRLDIILIGNDAPSIKYIETKKKACLNIGANCVLHLFDEEVLESKVIQLIEELNENNEVDGIVVQLPLPKKYNKDLIINSIALKKDIDGLTNLNMGNLFANNNSFYIPAAPKGIMTIFDHYDVNVKGKSVVIIGVSNLIGVPLFKLLIERGASVSLCTKHTNNLKEFTIKADIIISCVGKKNLINEDLVKDNCICIDVGITIENNKPYGDINESINKKAYLFTPTPGGTGPLTVSSLLENLFCSYKIHIS
jgi:methylenetetrahydrofolate dehydrogenase (NADP+)/methenyltetrahydrofolate cyclohydrolase